MTGTELHVVVSRREGERGLLRTMKTDSRTIERGDETYKLRVDPHVTLVLGNRGNLRSRTFLSTKVTTRKKK